MDFRRFGTLLLLVATLPAWGQGGAVLRLPGPPPLALPNWLAPVAQARDQSAKAAPTEASSAYATSEPPAAVIAHYERQMRVAGISFQTRRDGTDTWIEALTPNAAGTVRVAELKGGTTVEVKYELKHDPPPGEPEHNVPPLFARTNPAGRVDLSGVWLFTHVNGRFEGTIVLTQAGSGLTGRWHTGKGKSEPDTAVSGYIDGSRVILTRFIDNNQQNYALTLSPDGNRLDGFGDGWFINHANLNMQRSAGTAPPRTAAPAAARTGDHLSFPPPRGTWKWAIQSVAVKRGSGIGYTSFYYEAATGRSVDQALSLPNGATIVGVFPDDCAFSVRDALGNSFGFRNEQEAKAKELSPGTWSLFPEKCGGVALFLK